MSDTTTRDIQKLRAEITAWRRERYGRAPLPPRLWAEAVDVARRVGVNQARVALGVSYQGLQAHVERASTAPEFLELSGAEVLAAGPLATSGASIEISGRDVHVAVRLDSNHAIDVASLVEAVRGRP